MEGLGYTVDGLRSGNAAVRVSGLLLHIVFTSTICIVLETHKGF